MTRFNDEVTSVSMKAHAPSSASLVSMTFQDRGKSNQELFYQHFKIEGLVSCGQWGKY